MKHRAVNLSSIILIPLLVMGCELLGASDAGLGVRFELGATTYRAGDTIKAEFINVSGSPVYVVRVDCGYAGIEQLVGEIWIPLDLRLPCPANISYHLMPTGSELEISMPYAQLADLAESSSGTFRFSWDIAPVKDYERARPVRSAEFRLVSDGNAIP